MFSGIIKLTFDPVISNGENVNGRFGDTNIGRDEFVSCFFFQESLQNWRDQILSFAVYF